MQSQDPFDPNIQQQGDDVRKPYTSILIAVFAIVGGIALIYFSFGVFSSFTGGVESSSIHVQHVLQDQSGYAGYQAAQQPSNKECMETNSCDECLSLLPGRLCDCDKECASLKCVANQCQ